jgi:CubicO group peptidase (beta-lactamase class C family)
MSIKYRIPFYLLLGFLLCLANLQLSAQAITMRTIDLAAQRAIADTGAKGLAIAYIDKGRVKTVQTYGIRNAAGDPLTADTILYGASLTKAVFGYLSMQLAAEGHLKLDLPIASLLAKPLPEYGNLPAYGNWGDLAGDQRWKNITPRMALGHATGFANFAFLEPDKKLRIHFDPGIRYAYSGEGIMLLQFGIEKGLGLNIEDELQRRLFKPLGMTRTSLKWQDHFTGNNADGWDENGTVEAHDQRSRVRAAGSMDTSIANMAKMAAAMVRGYGLTPAQAREFSNGSIPITTRQQFPTLLPDAPETERPKAKAALGVISFDGPQGQGWFKGGHNDTTANTLVCLTKKQRCILIMANDVRAEKAFPGIVRALLGETGAPYQWEYPD